jgi:aerobic-type carbon monoxide dehydrogenase small subunit (CoxS/CutS family)
MTTQAVRLTVNGARREALAEARRTLADFLREDLALTGTHVGCEHGVCGACTVIVDGRAVRSCLMLAVQVDGSEVLTVEGLAKGGQLHPVQEAFWESHAFQCGFCTPGFIMTTLALLADEQDRLDELDEGAIRVALSGNICRCTGYQTIVAGVKAAIAKLASAEAEASEGAGVLPGT